MKLVERHRNETARSVTLSVHFLTCCVGKLNEKRSVLSGRKESEKLFVLIKSSKYNSNRRGFQCSTWASNIRYRHFLSRDFIMVPYRNFPTNILIINILHYSAALEKENEIAMERKLGHPHA